MTQAKVLPSKPFLVLLYGYPGAGKTTFSKQFAEELPVVHLYGERFRHELHEATHGEASAISSTLLHYMTKEFLRAGVSVILDANLTKKSERAVFRKLAKEQNVGLILVWIQIDTESAFARTQKRDRRKAEDKFATEYTVSDFQAIINESQNPDKEDYVVISGKHTFRTQKGAVMKKLFELGILDQETASRKVVKPGLVNLIPHSNIGGRGEFPRRNISIR